MINNIVDFCTYREKKELLKSLDGNTVHKFKKNELDDGRWKMYLNAAYRWACELVHEFNKGPIKTRSYSALVEHTHLEKDEGFFIASDEKTLIYRVYDRKTTGSVYRFIMNGPWLKENFEELYEAYLRAGVYSYLEREHPELIEEAFKIAK